MTDRIDPRLFPSIYTDGDAYYTVSDGQVWRWERTVVVGPFGQRSTSEQWRAVPADRMPADAQYACRAPEGLQEAVRRKGGELHRYNLHRGQEHLSEEERGLCSTDSGT